MGKPLHLLATFWNAFFEQDEIFKNIYDSADPTATLERNSWFLKLTSGEKDFQHFRECVRE